MVPWADPSFYAAASDAGPFASALVAGLLGLVGFGSLALVAIGIQRQAALRARAAKAAEDASERRGLQPGFAVLFGRVDTGDADPAVSVRVRQVGRTYSVEGGLRHVWSEVDRRVDARPFTLVLGSGDRVHVAPGGAVQLIDLLGAPPAPLRDPSLPRDVTSVRTRAAALGPGDLAYVTGRLVAPASVDAYRGAEAGYTLYPPARGRMLISSEPLEARFARRARFHGGWATACLAAFLLVHGVALGPYWTRLAFGQTVAARAIDARTWVTTSSRYGRTSHFSIDAIATLGGATVRLIEPTNEAYYAVVHRDLGERYDVTVPFVVVPSNPASHNIGPLATASVAALVATGFALLGLSLFYGLHAWGTRPWYDRKRIIDRGRGPIDVERRVGA